MSLHRLTLPLVQVGTHKIQEHTATPAVLQGLLHIEQSLVGVVRTLVNDVFVVSPRNRKQVCLQLLGHLLRVSGIRIRQIFPKLGKICKQLIIKFKETFGITNRGLRETGYFRDRLPQVPAKVGIEPSTVLVLCIECDNIPAEFPIIAQHLLIDSYRRLNLALSETLA